MHTYINAQSRKAIEGGRAVGGPAVSGVGCSLCGNLCGQHSPPRAVQEEGRGQHHRYSSRLVYVCMYVIEFKYVCMYVGMYVCVEHCRFHVKDI